MARSVNDRLQDETIAHGLYVTRYGNGVARRMLSLLNKLDADLAAKLLVLLDGNRPPASARRYDFSAGFAASICFTVSMWA
ncbi:TPA: hypothetical protein ACRZGO_004495 [Citrobacter braakii]